MLATLKVVDLSCRRDEKRATFLPQVEITEAVNVLIKLLRTACPVTGSCFRSAVPRENHRR